MPKSCEGEVHLRSGESRKGNEAACVTLTTGRLETHVNGGSYLPKY
jgi:hypothetical protein